jgi:hypothetical protein
MGRPKTPRVKRPTAVLTKLSERERELLATAALDSGMSPSEIMRCGLHLWVSRYPQAPRAALTD